MAKGQKRSNREIKKPKAAKEAGRCDHDPPGAPAQGQVRPLGAGRLSAAPRRPRADDAGDRLRPPDDLARQ